MTILDMKVTETEVNVLTGGVVSNVEEYLARGIKEPFLTRDAIELYIFRGQVDQAQKVLDTLKPVDRADLYPSGISFRE